MVEQRTHKPLVAGSIPASGTIFWVRAEVAVTSLFAKNGIAMPSTVYLLRGSTGRCYIGCTDDVTVRLAQHQRGHTHTTVRLGLPVTVIAKKSFSTRLEALRVERKLKSWKSPAKVQAFLEARPS